MTAPLAIIAGTGALPALLAQAQTSTGRKTIVAGIEGYTVEGIDPDLFFRVERLAPFLRSLLDQSVEEVVFAGAVRRPRLDPSLFDPETAALVPRILPMLQQGDDGLLRAVIALFEDAGLKVVGVADVAPDLVPTAGVLGSVEPSRADRKDAGRGAEILAALGALDLGQGVVVAQGLCLGVEALPGTDALLRGVAAMDAATRPDPAKGRGVFCKAPKPGQDRRIDLPTLGPRTVKGAAAAGLAGIAFEAGGVLMLDRAAMIAEADKLGLFLWAREP